MIKVTRKSQLTGKRHSMMLPITIGQYRAWRDSGAHVQDAFPNLTVEQREFLITGITPGEWDEHIRYDEMGEPE